MSPITIKGNPFRSKMELIRGTQQSLTGNDSSKADRNNISLDPLWEQTRGILSGLSKPKFILKSIFISNGKPLRRRLKVYSESSKKKVILRKLFSKFLWSTVNSLELEVLLNFALDLKEEYILEVIKYQKIIPIFLLRARLNSLLIIEGFKPFLFREFLNIRGFFLIIESEEIQFNSSPSVDKYTGWRRHQNDQGSLAPDKEDPFPLEPGNNLERYNISKALTVGIIHKSGEDSLKRALIKAETVRFNLLVKEFINEPIRRNRRTLKASSHQTD